MRTTPSEKYELKEMTLWKKEMSYVSEDQFWSADSKCIGDKS